MRRSLSIVFAVVLGAGLAASCTKSGGSNAPSDSCRKSDCGPKPGMPTRECADGSKGGFTGVCKTNAEGGCAWEIRQCPEELGGW